MEKINLKNRLKQRGIGLLELMLSLAIIAILLIMATRYYLVTSYSQRLNQVTSEISQIQGAAYSWKGNKGGYDGLTGGGLVAAGLVALGDTDAAHTKIVNPWGTEITVVGAATKVTVSFVGTADAEKRACEALKAKFGSSNDPAITASCDGGTFTYTFY